MNEAHDPAIAEHSVLGAILLNTAILDDVRAVLPSGNYFLNNENRACYDAILELADANQPIDTVTLFSEKGISATYLAGLTADIPSSANARSYALSVFQSSQVARLRLACSTIARNEGTPSKLLEEAIRLVEIVSESPVTGEIVKLADAMQEIERMAQHRIDNPNDAVGVTTGIPRLDTILSGGIKPQDLGILSARPSDGKTAFALNWGIHAAKTGTPVLAFSIEMSIVALAKRASGIMAGADWEKIYTGGAMASAQMYKIQQARRDSASMPFFICDSPQINLPQIASLAKRHVRRHGMALIIVDYLQLIKSTGRKNQNRYEAVGELSSGLKRLAREIKCPVLSLCQLGRGAEGGIPRLSDLRESGNIEQDADMVIALAPLPKDDQKAMESEYAQPENITIAYVLKHRNGPIGKTSLWFDRPLQRFTMLDKSTTPTSPSREQEAEQDEEYLLDDDDTQKEIPF